MALRHTFHQSHVWTELLGPVKAAKNMSHALLAALSQSQHASRNKPKRYQADAQPFQWKNPGQQAFVPETYEAEYAYPLIVWLHDDGSDEKAIINQMPIVSDRNYIALAMQAPFPKLDAKTGDLGYFWSYDQPQVDSLEDEIYESMCQMRRTLNIHSERIYIAGIGAGATMATKIALNHPEWFAGIVSIDGQTPPTDRLLAKYRQIQHLRLLLSGTSDQSSSNHDRTELANILHSAGVDVQQLDYPGCTPDSREVLVDIDRFIMQGIC